MRILLVLTAILVATVGANPVRAQDSGSAFAIGGIDVDAIGKNVDEARTIAFREAQRRAWKQLYARMTGNPASSAPTLRDNALDGIISGIEVEAERFSTKRYIARLGVIFDRVRAGRYLGNDARVLQSRPMLLLPVLTDGATRTVYETKTPWVRAWTRFRGAASPIQYVRAQGTSADNLLLTSYQARRDNRAIWRNILNRFEAEDVLTAEAKLDRSYPGGPIVGTFTARHGPDAQVLGRFRLTANSAGELETMLDEAVRRVDGIYSQALRDGRLRIDEELTFDLAPLDNAAPTIADTAPDFGVEVAVATPDAGSWASLERAIRGTPTVSGVAIVSLSLGGTSRIRIGHSESFDWLRYSLDQNGLRLEPSPYGLRIRPRVAGDVPIERPMTAEEITAIRTAGAATQVASPGTPVTPMSPVQQPDANDQEGPVDLLPNRRP